jgi:hypothetical protein
MNRRLPVIAIVLGVAGLIPFIACGLTALSSAEPRASQLLAALIGYGAVTLSFLGGVHWGFALIEEPPRAERERLVLGVLPALCGWLALLVGLVVPAEAGLAVLIVGFIATIVLEAQARNRHSLLPGGYMTLRWGLSIVVVAILVTVLVLRLIGARIVL